MDGTREGNGCAASSGLLLVSDRLFRVLNFLLACSAGQLLCTRGIRVHGELQAVADGVERAWDDSGMARVFLSALPLHAGVTVELQELVSICCQQGGR